MRSSPRPPPKMNALGERGPPHSELLRPGQVIDSRYEVVELISRGETADVYRVRHRVLGRSLALKALRADCVGDAEWSGRLLREAKALGVLEHPNIVSVTDSGWLGAKAPYFVMEYVAGVALERLLAAHSPLDPGLAVEVTIGVCDALDAAHRLGIIHRDLKPNNIHVVARKGQNQVKVLDFGLARVRGHGRLTRPNTSQGTPAYMSPEQVSGGDVDARTDIYSLGVTLYEMLCGRVPFGSSSYVALSHQHMYAPPPPFSSWLPAASAALALEPIVLRCLAKDARERYPSAQALSRALAPHRAPDKTLRLPRGAVPFRAAAPRSREGAAQRGVRIGKLLRWALVGCCAGALLLALVHWLSMGRG